MKFEPGQSGNPGGRPKGTANRWTLLRDAILEAVTDIGVEIQKKAGRKPNRSTAAREYLHALILATGKKEPGNLLRTITSILPKHVNIGDGGEPLHIVIGYSEVNGKHKPEP